MSENITPLIMCGGAGTRLWPASREGRPKQFLRLFGAHSTFQDTVLRVAEPALFARPIVITNAAYRFLVLEQLAEIGIEADILLEPLRRDSGPAIAAGAAFAKARDENAVVLALAADHVVNDVDAFRAACREGLAVAREGWIVTFGVVPDHPATEYGYIRPGEELGPHARSVAAFVEKPDAAKAARYMADGYLWNTGNFMFGAAALLDEYRAQDAASVDHVEQAIARAGRDLGFVTLDPDTFAAAAPISIDYAVMEKTKRAAMVPADMDWSDIGNWQALHEALERDESGNAVRGREVELVDCSNVLVDTDGPRVSVIGLENVIVVVDGDDVMITSAAGVQKVGKLSGAVNQ